MTEKVVVFPKNYQKKFICDNKSVNKTWKEFASSININWRILVSAYKYQYCNIPYRLFKNICLFNNKNIETELKKYNAIVRDKENPIGKSCFGVNRTKLPEIFEDEYNIYEDIPLDTNHVEFSRYDYKKEIILPTKLTPLLAEEIGMHLGDGFLSSKRYEYRLKGNKDEREYYDDHIKNMYKELFNLNLPIKEWEKTYGFELRSMAFWNFKAEVLKIQSGRKDNITIPIVLKVKNKKLLCAFVRGIMDTDGSVSFSERYGYGNYYPTISISLKSTKLIYELYDILIYLGLKPIKSYSRDKYIISLNGYERLARYSKLIGWSNPKHLNKVKLWKTNYPNLSMAVVA